MVRLGTQTELLPLSSPTLIILGELLPLSSPTIIILGELLPLSSPTPIIPGVGSICFQSTISILLMEHAEMSIICVITTGHYISFHSASNSSGNKSG